MAGGLRALPCKVVARQRSGLADGDMTPDDNFCAELGSCPEMQGAAHRSPERRAKDLAIPLARLVLPEGVTQPAMFPAKPDGRFFTGQGIGINDRSGQRLEVEQAEVGGLLVRQRPPRAADEMGRSVEPPIRAAPD